MAVADACVVLADAAAPLTSDAARIAAAEGVNSGLIVVPQAVDDIVLLTQTCDLQFTTADEHRCLVAPVIRVPKLKAYEALRGRRPGLAGLPWVDEMSVADLSRITAVERSMLLDAVSRGQPRNPVERIHSAQTVSRYLTRPALPDPINKVLSPFVVRIAQKHGRHSAEGRCAYDVSELRVEATPDLDADEPALNVLLVLDETKLPRLPAGVVVDDDRIDALSAAGPTAAGRGSARCRGRRRQARGMDSVGGVLDHALGRGGAPDVAGVGSLEITVLNGEELSYARSLNAPTLDLRYLSTRAS